jgi:hypothetical protein
MCSLDQMIARVQNLDFEAKAINTVNETSYGITQPIQTKLYGGYLSTDEDITPEYSNKYYAEKKARLNPSARGNPDTYLTGQFYKDMFVELNKDEYVIGSGVAYSDKLEALYGPNLLRLSEKDKIQYGEVYLRPRLLAYINRKLLKLDIFTGA